MKQLSLLQSQPKAYGGNLLKTRKGRSRGRPLDTKHTMHLVLRSSKAVGLWSFKRAGNERKIKTIIEKFSDKYDVRILSVANVGNHLHFQIKLANRYTFKPFIRAITAAIMMAITGVSRWHKNELKGERFWDWRPFTRVVCGFRAFLNLRDYIQINQIEGYGNSRGQSRMIVERVRSRRHLENSS